MWPFRAHPEKLDGLALGEFQNFRVARYQWSLPLAGRFNSESVSVRNREATLQSRGIENQLRSQDCKAAGGTPALPGSELPHVCQQTPNT